MQSLEHLFVHGIPGRQMDVRRTPVLADSVDAPSGLLIIAHVVVKRVEDHGGGRRQRKPGACCRNLSEEYCHIGIFLKGRDLLCPFFAGDTAMNDGVADALLIQHP